MVIQRKPNVFFLLQLLVFLCLYSTWSAPVLCPMTTPASNICSLLSLLSNHLTCFDTTRFICWKPCPQPCFPLVLHLLSHWCSFRVSFRPCSSFPSLQQSLQSSFRIQMEILLSFSRSISMNPVLSKNSILKCLCIYLECKFSNLKLAKAHTNFWEKGMNCIAYFSCKHFKPKHWYTKYYHHVGGIAFKGT